MDDTWKPSPTELPMILHTARFVDEKCPGWVLMEGSEDNGVWSLTAHRTDDPNRSITVTGPSLKDAAISIVSAIVSAPKPRRA